MPPDRGNSLPRIRQHQRAPRPEGSQHPGAAPGDPHADRTNLHRRDPPDREPAVGDPRGHQIMADGGKIRRAGGARGREDTKHRRTIRAGNDWRRIRIRRRHAGQDSLDRQAPYARFRRPATFDDADIHPFRGQRQVGRRHAQARQRQRDDQTGKFVRARDRQADHLPGDDAMGHERTRRRIDHPVERPVRHACMIRPDDSDRGGVEASRAPDGFGNVHADAIEAFILRRQGRSAFIPQSGLAGNKDRRKLGTTARDLSFRA